MHTSIDCTLFKIPPEVFLGHADGIANFVAGCYIDGRPFRPETIPPGSIAGSGLGNMSADNLHVKGLAYLRDDLGHFYTENLTMEVISFSSFSIDLGENFTIEEEKVNWEELNRNFKPNFDQDLATYNDAITEKIRLAFNVFVKVSN